MMRGRIAVLVLFVVTLTGLPALPAGAAADPLPPTGLTATAVSALEVALGWNPVDGATEYRIYRGISPSQYDYYASTTATSYRDTYVYSGITYLYAVQTVTRKAVSQLSAFVQVSTPPTAPGYLQARALSADRVELTWGAPGQGAVSYAISEVAADGTEHPATVLESTSSSVVVRTVAETHYVFRVRSRSQAGLLSYDYATVEITTPPREASFIGMDSEVPAGETTLIFVVRGLDFLGPQPGGTLAVSVDGGPVVTVPVYNGGATLTVTVEPGTHTASADYSGDGEFQPAHADLTFYAAVPAPEFAVDVVDAAPVNSAAAADVTCDGRTDLLTVSYSQDGSGSTLLVRPGQTDGTLGPARSTAVPANASFAAGDLNRDGCADVALVGPDLLTFLGSPSGLTTGTRARTSGSMSNLTLYDITHDGLLDAVANDVTGVVLLPGTGRGGFGRLRTIVPELATYRVGDLNGDGLLDVVTRGDSPLQGWFQSGTGQFSLGWTSTEGISPFVVGDLTGDGRAEVVAADATGQTSVVVLSGQDGQRQAAVPVSFTWWPDALAISDVDGDGQGDIVGMSFYQPTQATLVSLTYAGAPTYWQDRTVYPYGFYPFGFMLADVSQDGRTDVVVWSGFDGVVVARQT